MSFCSCGREKKPKAELCAYCHSKWDYYGELPPVAMEYAPDEFGPTFEPIRQQQRTWRAPNRRNGGGR